MSSLRRKLWQPHNSNSCDVTQFTNFPSWNSIYKNHTRRKYYCSLKSNNDGRYKRKMFEHTFFQPPTRRRSFFIVIYDFLASDIPKKEPFGNCLCSFHESHFLLFMSILLSSAILSLDPRGEKKLTKWSQTICHNHAPERHPLIIEIGKGKKVEAWTDESFIKRVMIA